VAGFGTCWDGWFGWRLVILGDEKLFLSSWFSQTYIMEHLDLLYCGWFPNQAGKDYHANIWNFKSLGTPNNIICPFFKIYIYIWRNSTLDF
jgi:hypothetical protein